LATRLEREQDWSCADTDDEHQKDTRYIRPSVRPAHRMPAAPLSHVVAPSEVIADAGSFAEQHRLVHHRDLCPSRRPLDRAFLETLLPVESPLPSLSISGTWLTRHRADFEWLRDQERLGTLKITWVDHSYDHPYVPGRGSADNFLLMRGRHAGGILDTERLLIANGETPSVFFRFPA